MRFVICTVLLAGLGTPVFAAHLKKAPDATLTFINDCSGEAVTVDIFSGNQDIPSRTLEPGERFTQEIDFPDGTDQIQLLVNVTIDNVVANAQIGLARGESLTFSVDCNFGLTEVAAAPGSGDSLREFSVLASAMVGLCCLGFIGSCFGRAPGSEADEVESAVLEADTE